jgi:hypothetical protein
MTANRRHDDLGHNPVKGENIGHPDYQWKDRAEK